MRIGRLYRRSVIVAGVLIAGIVLALNAAHGLRALDVATIDWRFHLRGSEGAPKNIEIVGIDAGTFSVLNQHFPFPRRDDARVIRTLKRDGAKVIAVDIQYTEPTDTTDDNALITAVRNADNVVLATTDVAKGGQTRIFGGAQGLAYSRATPAESQFPVDPDGEIRRMRAKILDLRTFPVAVAERYLHRPVSFPAGSNGTELIDFRGPAGTVPMQPYWKVLQNKVAASTFRGKIVIVGVTDPTEHDIHATSTAVQMTGAEVQANAIDTVLRDFPLGSGPGWLTEILIIGFGLSTPLLAMRVDAAFAAGVTLIGLIVFAVACQLAFDGGTIIGFIYPVAAAILSMISTMLLQGARTVYEREQVRDAFARFVPESVVSEVLAQAEGIRLGGVRRHVTVLFSDLRGFTTFSEHREPDETLSILNRYLSAMTDAILDHGGTLVSYMGDGIMAVFGAPLEQPDHAERAIAAAQDMLGRLAEFNQELRQEGVGDGFKMGIGLNSGEVMSGNVGSEKRLEYTTIGDTTNTASRIEGMTKGTPHQLFIADSTHRDLGRVRDDLVPVGEFEVRGRAEKVKLWGLAEVEARTGAEAEPEPDTAPARGA
jgi:adenylate cyclase